MSNPEPAPVIPVRPKARSKYLTLRFWMFQLHLWLGLIVGIAFTLVGVSGSMMIACEWYDNWGNRDVVYVTPQGNAKAFSEVLGAFKAAYPNSLITSVTPPRNEGRSWVFVIPTPAAAPASRPAPAFASEVTEEERAKIAKALKERRARELAAQEQASTRPSTQPSAAPATQPRRESARAAEPAPEQQTIAQWKARRQQRALAVRRVFVDPYTLKVLGERHSGIRTDTYVFWEHMHYFLLLDQKNGYQINGWLGVATLVVLATGLVLWWPNTIKVLLMRVWVKWNAPWVRVNWDIHNALGFWALPILFIAMLTGIFYPFNQSWRPAINQMTGTPENPVTKFTITPKADGTPATLEEMLVNLAKTLPSARVLSISNADGASGDVRVNVNEPSYGVLYRNAVLIDRASGQVASIDRPMTANSYVLRGIFPVHAGYIFGEWMRVVFFVLGFSPLVLFVTGVWIWAARQVKKFKAKRSAVKAG